MHSIGKIFREISILGILIVVIGNPVHSSTFTSLFNRDNQTYRWDTNLLYRYAPIEQFNFVLDSRIQSTLIKESLVARGEDQWQEDRSARGTLNYKFSERLGASGSFMQRYNALGERHVHDSEAMAGIIYNPNRWLRLSYNLGGAVSSRDEQIGERVDRGVKMSWGALFNRNILGADLFNAEFKIHEAIYTAIPSNEFSFTGEYHRYSGDRDSMVLKYSDFRGRKSYYASSFSLAGTNTQKKHERALDARLLKEIFWDLELQVNGYMSFNQYRYLAGGDTSSSFITLQDRNNSRLFQDITFRLARGIPVGGRNMEVYISYHYNGYDEDFGLNERDEKSASGELGGGINMSLTDDDSLNMDASTGVRSFYHPDDFAELSDRDVVSEMVNISYIHIWSRYLTSGVDFGYRNFHQIYISKYRSADNNKNYTYLLSPEIIWTVSDRLTITQDFEIQANYITYDFEKRLLNSRNRIFRRGDSRTGMVYGFSGRLKFRFEYGYRYEDYGQLIWDEQWQQHTSWDRRTHLGYAGLDYYPVSHLRITPGYGFDYKREWEHSEIQQVSDEGLDTEKQRTMRDRQDQRMITLEIEYIFSELERFTFTAARRNVRGWRRGHFHDDNFTVSLTRTF